MVTRATLQLHHGECMSSFNCHDSSMIIHHDHDHFYSYHVNINMNINMYMIYKYILRVTNPTSSKHVFEHYIIYLSIYSVCVLVFPCIPLFVDNLPIHR